MRRMAYTLIQSLSGNSSGANGAPNSSGSPISSYSGLSVAEIGICWTCSCSHAVWKDDTSEISNSSGMSGIPGVNMFCILASKTVSLLRSMFVVPEMGLICVPFDICTCWLVVVSFPTRLGRFLCIIHETGCESIWDWDEWLECNLCDVGAMCSVH